MTEVRLAQDSDISPFYWQHLVRHSKESGENGDIIFTPDEHLIQSEEMLKKEKTDKWLRSVKEPGWEKCWVVVDDQGIYGSLRLYNSGLKSTLHRATLIMGIERSHRQQGWGKRLMTEALSWASMQHSLEWVDLYVFAHNQLALQLYSKVGFQKVGIVVDQFRIQGQKIDDLHLTLNLRG